MKIIINHPRHHGPKNPRGVERVMGGNLDRCRRNLSRGQRISFFISKRSSV